MADIIYMEDVIEGMMDNASDSEIDTSLTVFNRIKKALKSDKREICAIIDEESIMEPEWLQQEFPTKFKILSKTDLPGRSGLRYIVNIMEGTMIICREVVQGNVWFWFADEEEANLYYNFCDGAYDEPEEDDEMEGEYTLADFAFSENV